MDWREERGQPFLFVTLDLWSTAKARDSFACCCVSFIQERMEVDRDAYVRDIEAQMVADGDDEKEHALAIARGTTLDPQLVLHLLSCVLLFQSFPKKSHTGLNIAKYAHRRVGTLRRRPRPLRAAPAVRQRSWQGRDCARARAAKRCEERRGRSSGGVGASEGWEHHRGRIAAGARAPTG